MAKKDKETKIDRDDVLVVEGTVTEVFPSGKFNVQLKNGHDILAYLSGKMRRNYIRVLLGDRVTVELTPYDLERGRIVYRFKKSSPQTAS